MDEKSVKGIIFDIQQFSVHDGPGIRTNVFLKGCPLHCDWCCNPESQKTWPQPLYDAEKCIGCGNCVSECQSGAISTKSGYRIDTSKCRDCTSHSCADKCYSKALTIAGKVSTAEEIADLVEKDAIFYESSHGGVTLSGGEAVMQADFAVEILKLCKERGISTAMETCSACSWEDIQKTLPYVDEYLCDVKHTNAEKMLEETGGDACKILDNIRKLQESGANIIARVPVIPGFNSDPEEIKGIGKYLIDTGIQRVNLLTYHTMGEPKYGKIFSDHFPKKREALEDGEMENLVQILKDMGLKASLG